MNRATAVGLQRFPAKYFGQKPWITWSDGEATLRWADFLNHVGARKKDVPAFDAFDLSAGENNEFGFGTTKARHFTLPSLRHATGDTWIGTVTGYAK